FDYAPTFQSASTSKKLFSTQPTRNQLRRTHRFNHLAVTVSRALDYAQFSALPATERRLFHQAVTYPTGAHIKKAAQGRLCILQLAA
ncbi:MULTISPECIES: hypothetical protein, partial [unclassified Variovorax]|uniref:hypothetical protein n=1 Tax=unclassified Variovorax TaxID=663243 RepID=UPI003F463E07